MNVWFGTDPGTSGVNEDWVGATTGVVVVLDGITTPPGMDDSGCVHGTPWFVSMVGTQLLHAVARASDDSLSSALGAAISRTAAQHSDTCDLRRPAVPAAGLAMVRLQGDQLDYLVLYDAVVVLETEAGIQVATDLRGHDIVADLRKATFAHAIGSADHTRNRQLMVEQQRARRNKPSGYWTVASTPEAAQHAITGCVPVAQLKRAAVLSDGAAALVEYGLAGWHELLDILEAEGPSSLIERVRSAEGSDPRGLRWPRFKPSDDATAVLLSGF